MMKAGRHRSFDKNIALEKAMDIFWTNGYPGTSLTDLTTAMGINKPSLYSAFGNKEALFNSALNLYIQKYGISHAAHLNSVEQSLKDRIQAYLISIATMATDPKLPGGCFVSNSTCEVGGTCLPVDAHHAVINTNKQTKSFLVEFFTAEKVNGNLKSEYSPQMMTNYLLTLQFGLAVMARDGAGLKELEAVIKQSISNF